MNTKKDHFGALGYILQLPQYEKQAALFSHFSRQPRRGFLKKEGVQKHFLATSQDNPEIERIRIQAKDRVIGPKVVPFWDSLIEF